MPIIKQVCFLFTVCIIQNMNQNRLILRYIASHNLILNKKTQSGKTFYVAASNKFPVMHKH